MPGSRGLMVSILTFGVGGEVKRRLMADDVL
jgi:hypothetical protein